MEELGISEPGIARLARAVYGYLGLISYFTVVKTKCGLGRFVLVILRKAAGKIHSDIERGFIRAEVVSYEDFIEHGSMQKVKGESDYSAWRGRVICRMAI